MIEKNTLYPLQIHMNRDGVDFTHFHSAIGHTLTPKELPDRLWNNLSLFISHLFETTSIETICFNPQQTPQYRFIPTEERLLQELFRKNEKLIVLTAWWMEWSHRRRVAGKRDWKCLECDAYVLQLTEHCSNSECLSHEILEDILGERPLKLIQQASPSIRLPPQKPFKKTGTTHR